MDKKIERELDLYIIKHFKPISEKDKKYLEELKKKYERELKSKGEKNERIRTKQR